MSYPFARFFIGFFRVILMLLFVPSILVVGLSLLVIVPHVWKHGITDQLTKGEVIAPAIDKEGDLKILSALGKVRTSDVPTAVVIGGTALISAVSSAFALAMLDVIRAVVDTAQQTKNIASLEHELVMLRCYALSQMKTEKDWDAMAGNLTGVDHARLAKAGWQKSISFLLAEKRIESR